MLLIFSLVMASGFGKDINRRLNSGIIRISFFVSKCVSCEIHKGNIYISNDDLNTEIMKHILFSMLFSLETTL